MRRTKKSITLYCVILTVLAVAVIFSGCPADVDANNGNRSLNELGYTPWEWPFGSEENWYEFNTSKEGNPWFYPFASEEAFYKAYNSVEWRDATLDDIGLWYVKYAPVWHSCGGPGYQISEEWYTRTPPLRIDGQLIFNQRYDDEQGKWVVYKSKYF